MVSPSSLRKRTRKQTENDKNQRTRKMPRRSQRRSLAEIVEPDHSKASSSSFDNSEKAPASPPMSPRKNMTSEDDIPVSPRKNMSSGDDIPLLRRTGSCLGEAAVEEQTMAIRDTNTIWNVCASGDLDRLKDMVRADPDVVWERGFVGETPVHLCCLLGKQDLADWLVDHNPEVATSQYAGQPYEGENCLHIAIVNKDHAMAQSLAQRFPSLLRQPATGAFFQDGAPLTPGGEATPCYYGDFALHFAASTNQPRVFDMLLALDPASLYLQDSKGNTVLHMCTVHEQPEMYDYVCACWEKQKLTHPDLCSTPLWQVKNKDEHTPLVLAAHRGSKVMFEHILERSRQVQWQYGPVTCLLYPLAELDLIPGAPQGALEAIVVNEHHKLLEVPRVVDLLRKKWETFGKRIFLQNFMRVLLFLLLFTCCTVYRNDEEHYSSSLRELVPAGNFAELRSRAQNTAVSALLGWDPSAIKTCLLALGDVLVFIASMSKLKREVGELRQEGWAGYFGCSGAAFLENFCSITFCLGIVCVAVLRLGFFASTTAENAVLCVISLVGWCYMLFFLLGYPSTGPVVVMMQKMFVQDVFLFICIYCVLLVGFAQAFFVELDGHTGWSGLLRRVEKCFTAMLGDFNLEDYTQSDHPTLSTFLICVYIVSISVMLLNLLIAMMGDTYSKVLEEAKMIWQLELARIMFSIETEMTPEERIKNLALYQIEIDGAKYVQVYKVDHDHFKWQHRKPIS